MPVIKPTTNWSVNTIGSTTTAYKIKNVLIYGSSSSNKIIWESITSEWGD